MASRAADVRAGGTKQPLAGPMGGSGQRRVCCSVVAAAADAAQVASVPRIFCLVEHIQKV
ncbi:hypothetical protein GCM10010440_72920 [Kitasatospora cinereorecta]